MTGKGAANAIKQYKIDVSGGNLSARVDPCLSHGKSRKFEPCTVQ